MMVSGLKLSSRPTSQEMSVPIVIPMYGQGALGLGLQQGKTLLGTMLIIWGQSIIFKLLKSFFAIVK